MSRGRGLLRRQSVAQAAVFLSVVTLFSKFVGFARDAIVAHNWGATGLTDAFLIGMMVPSVLLGIVSTGLSTIIVPWYIAHRKEDPARARELVNQVTFVWGMAFLAASLLVVAFAPQLVHLFAPSFTDFRYDVAVKVTRLLVPMGFFNVMTGLVTGLSQAEGQFLIPLLSNVFGNVLMVGCLIFFASPLGIQSYSLGQTVMSVIGFAPVLWFLVRRRGFFRHFDMRHVDWRAIGSFAALLVPLVISGGGGSLNTVVDRWFASHLSQGSVSALDYSNRLWNLPLALAATPIVTAVFPWFSSMAVDGTLLATFEDRVRKTVGLMIYIMVPCIAGLVVLAQPIVRLLFERGAFDASATSLTAACVQMYCLGLIGQALFPVFHRVFYSFKDTRTPLIVGVVMIAINAVTDWLLRHVVRSGGNRPLDDGCRNRWCDHGCPPDPQVLPGRGADDCPLSAAARGPEDAGGRDSGRGRRVAVPDVDRRSPGIYSSLPCGWFWSAWPLRRATWSPAWFCTSTAGASCSARIRRRVTRGDGGQSTDAQDL